MNNEALLFYRGFIPQIWKLFTSWYLPGTDVTPAGMAVFLIVISVAITTIKRLSNTPDGSGSASPGSGGSNLPANR